MSLVKKNKKKSLHNNLTSLWLWGGRPRSEVVSTSSNIPVRLALTEKIISILLLLHIWHSLCIHIVISKMNPCLLSVAYICLYRHHHHRGAQRLFTTLTFVNRSPTKRRTHSRPSARYSDNFTFSSSVKSILSGGQIIGVLIFLCVSNHLVQPLENAIVAFMYFSGCSFFPFLITMIIFLQSNFFSRFRSCKKKLFPSICVWNFFLKRIFFMCESCVVCVMHYITFITLHSAFFFMLSQVVGRFQTNSTEQNENLFHSVSGEFFTHEKRISSEKKENYTTMERKKFFFFFTFHKNSPIFFISISLMNLFLLSFIHGEINFLDFFFTLSQKSTFSPCFMHKKRQKYLNFFCSVQTWHHTHTINTSVSHTEKKRFLDFFFKCFHRWDKIYLEKEKKRNTNPWIFFTLFQHEKQNSLWKVLSMKKSWYWTARGGWVWKAQDFTGDWSWNLV